MATHWLNGINFKLFCKVKTILLNYRNFLSLLSSLELTRKKLLNNYGYYSLTIILIKIFIVIKMKY